MNNDNIYFRSRVGRKLDLQVGRMTHTATIDGFKLDPQGRPVWTVSYNVGTRNAPKRQSQDILCVQAGPTR